MKNRVSLEAYGEILAGRIARPYEKGTPRAKQGDEYWFFIKHFASISRENASEWGSGWRQSEKRKERRTDRQREGRRRTDGRRRGKSIHKSARIVELNKRKDKTLTWEPKLVRVRRYSKYTLVADPALRFMLTCPLCLLQSLTMPALRHRSACLQIGFMIFFVAQLCQPS